MNGDITHTTEASRIAELLGLTDNINSSASLNAKVSEGLPASALESILRKVHAQPAQPLIPDRAYRRARTEGVPLSREKSQTLYDFARVYRAAESHFNGYGLLVSQFLEKPNPDLGGASPIAMAVTGPAGADAVIDLLGRPNSTARTELEI